MRGRRLKGRLFADQCDWQRPVARRLHPAMPSTRAESIAGGARNGRKTKETRFITRYG